MAHMLQKILLPTLLLLFAAALFGAASIYEFTLNSIDGTPAPLSAYRGKVVLMVKRNVLRGSCR